MAEFHSRAGVHYHVLSNEEFKAELFLMSGRKAATASAASRAMDAMLRADSQPHREQAWQQIRSVCPGACHGVRGQADRIPMPADEQRKIAYFVLTGIALTAASGGLGMIANTGRGIQFGYALQRGAQTATAATRAGAQTTWAVSSDLATRTVVATAPVTLNPRMQETVIDFSTSLFPGAPAMSGAGAVGAAAGMITNPHEALR